MSVPSTVMVPAHGRSAPAIADSTVGLPAPFAPTRAPVSPEARSRPAPNSAWQSPYPASSPRTDSVLTTLASLAGRRAGGAQDSGAHGRAGGASKMHVSCHRAAEVGAPDVGV